MAKNLGELRNATRTYLDEATQADWTDVEIDREVNNGYQEVVAHVMDTYEDFYVVKDSLNTVANQQEYGTADGLPSSLFKIRRVEINYRPDQTNIFTRALPIHLDDVHSDLAAALEIGVPIMQTASRELEAGFVEDLAAYCRKVFPHDCDVAGLLQRGARPGVLPEILVLGIDLDPGNQGRRHIDP